MDNSDFHILIVDDEPELAEIAAETFELEGFKVTYKCSGMEALEVFENQSVDVVISDARMPEMKGIELLEKILAHQKKMPLFYLWTGDTDISESELIEKGATGLIPKPCGLNDLIDRIIETLKSRE